jgi:hypothetical protein
MKRFWILPALLLAFPLTARAQFETSSIKDPPPKYSKAQIARWVAESVAEIEPEMSWKLIDTAPWADYMNYSHFVPLTCDGVTEKLDFDWIAEENPRRSLASAEVVESGELHLWWKLCDYYADNPDYDCREEIHSTVFHEAIHHRQGKKLGLLRSQLWGNCAHYQCREVAAYMEEIHQKTIPDEYLPYYAPLLSFYTKGCENSLFKSGYTQDLKEMREILRTHPPIQAK